MAKIPIILEPGRADGKLVSSGAIFDENKGMFQSEINDIQDTLNSDNPNKPLSAKQGKILKELLDSKVIEAGDVPIDTEPTEGNITHVVNSDGLAKEFNKCNTTIINTDRIANEAIIPSKLSVDIQNLITNLSKTTTFTGIATPTTDPGTPDGPVFYIATTAGNYLNFGNIEVLKGETAILKWNSGTWTKSSFKPMTDFNSVFNAEGNSLTHELDTLGSNISELDKNVNGNLILSSTSTVTTETYSNFPISSNIEPSSIIKVEIDGVTINSVRLFNGITLIDRVDTHNKVIKIETSGVVNMLQVTYDSVPVDTVISVKIFNPIAKSEIYCDNLIEKERNDREKEDTLLNGKIIEIGGVSILKDSSKVIPIGKTFANVSLPYPLSNGKVYLQIKGIIPIKLQFFNRDLVNRKSISSGNLNDVLVDLEYDDVSIVQIIVDKAVLDDTPFTISIDSPASNFEHKFEEIRNDIKTVRTELNDRFTNELFIDSQITFSPNLKYANLSLKQSLNNGDRIRIIVDDNVDLDYINFMRGYTGVQRYTENLNDLILEIKNDGINLIQFGSKKVYQEKTAFDIKIYKNPSIYDDIDNIQYYIKSLQKDTSVHFNKKLVKMQEVNTMLSSVFPTHNISLIKRMNASYDFGDIEITDDFVVPNIGGNVTINVTTNPQVHKSTKTENLISVNEKICVGTPDCYDVYIVNTVNELEITCTLLKNGMNLVGSTINASNNILAPSGQSITIKHKVMLYDDIIAYSYNVMPTTLSIDDLHPNANGFSILNNILVDEINSHFGGAKRLIAFGDSWTGMSHGWKDACEKLGAECVAKGVGGDWIEHIMARFNTFMETYSPAEGDIFIFLMGTNNYYADIWAADPNHPERKLLVPFSDNVVSVFRSACENISSKLPNGNWLVSNGHYLSTINKLVE